MLVDDQPVSAVDAMLAGLRFVRQGERARLEVSNLGRFASMRPRGVSTQGTQATQVDLPLYYNIALMILPPPSNHILQKNETFAS